jgi:hypothetical protein
MNAKYVQASIRAMMSRRSRGYRAVGDNPGRDEVAARLYLQAVDLSLARRRDRCDAIPEDVR